MDSKVALITGINGFTGKYVAAELEAAGYAVYGTGIGASDSPRYFQVDLLDKFGLAKVVSEVQPTVVVHLAAIAFVGHGDVDAFYQVNLIGTHNLLEVLTQHAGKLTSVLLASSANVYGNNIFTRGRINNSASLFMCYYVFYFYHYRVTRSWLVVYEGSCAGNYLLSKHLGL